MLGGSTDFPLLRGKSAEPNNGLTRKTLCSVLQTHEAEKVQHAVDCLCSKSLLCQVGSHNLLTDLHKLGSQRCLGIKMLDI